MESAEKDKEMLISSIETDARAEEQQIIADAEKQAAEKKKYAEQKIESILETARSEAQEKAEKVTSKIMLSIELEVKRLSMHARDSVIRQIMTRAEEKISSMINDANYKDVLINWIAEAAIGLDAQSARVNASEKERYLINEKLLEQACEKIKNKTGKNVELSLSDEKPLKSQGVILTATDGRIAFNNQVKTRMMRKQREIQKLIYNKVLAGTEKE